MGAGVSMGGGVSLASLPDLSTVPQFVAPNTMTIATLLANYPASATYRGMYARVSDYGGYVDRVLRCDYDSGLNLFFYVPTQPEYARSIPITSDMTLAALTSPTSIIFTGNISLGVTRNVTFDLTNARPGMIWEVTGGLATLLGTLNLLGTGLGSGVSLLLGGYQKYVVDGSTGSLKLVRLV